MRYTTRACKSHIVLWSILFFVMHCLCFLFMSFWLCNGKTHLKIIKLSTSSCFSFLFKASLKLEIVPEYKQESLGKTLTAPYLSRNLGFWVAVSKETASRVHRSLFSNIANLCSFALFAYSFNLLFFSARHWSGKLVWRELDILRVENKGQYS